MRTKEGQESNDGHGGVSVRVLDEALTKELDRDVATKLRVTRTIHLTHPSGSKMAGDLVYAKARNWSEHHKQLAGSTACRFCHIGTDTSGNFYTFNWRVRFAAPALRT